MLQKLDFKNISEQDRFRLITRVTALFFLIGIIMSPKLWMTGRIFPLIPFFDLIPSYPTNFDWALFAFLISSLLFVVIKPNRTSCRISIVVMLFFLLQDQMRWQPWVYMYLLFLLPMATLKNETNSYCVYFQIIIIGIYIWGGVHKLNPAFLDTTFCNITKGFFMIQNEDFLQQLRIFGYLIPLGEIIMGCLLIFPKTRQVGVTLAIASHFFILVFLSPFGISYNQIVYPWNVAMMAYVYLVFNEDAKPFQVRSASNFRLQILNVLGILLLWIMPLFSHFGLWDHYLSFSLYSGRTSYFYIKIDEERIKEFGSEVLAFHTLVPSLPNEKYIDVNLWAMSELNVPFYPESRVFKQLSERFCAQISNETDICFLEKEPPYNNPNFESFKCQ